MLHLIDTVDGVLFNARIKAAEDKRRNGNWYPACGGTETPFKSRSGRTLLYCYQPSTGNHGYIDTQTDLLLSEDEARQALQTY